MSEQLRDVRIRMNAEMGKKDAFSAFQREAKATNDLMEKMTRTMKMSGDAAAAAADKAKRSWRGVWQEIGRGMTMMEVQQRRVQAAGSGGAGLTALGGRFGMGAIGIGAATAGAGFIGTIGSMRAAQREGTQLQMSDLDPISRMALEFRDRITNREIRQRALDERLERAGKRWDNRIDFSQKAQANRFQLNEVSRLGRLTNPDVMGLRPQDMMTRLRGEQNEFRGEERGWVAQRQMRQDFVNKALLDIDRGIPGASERHQGHTKAREESEKLIAQSQAKQLELLRQQAGIQQSINQSQMERVSSLRQSVAGLDPMERDRAIQLGTKFKAVGAEGMEPGEWKELRGLPGGADLLDRAQMERDEKTGFFNTFLRTMGRPEDERALDQMKAIKNVGPVPLRVEVVIAENDLAAIREEVRAVLRRQLETDRQNQHNRNAADDRQFERGAARGAVGGQVQ